MLRGVRDSLGSEITRDGLSEDFKIGSIGVIASDVLLGVVEDVEMDGKDSIRASQVVGLELEGVE
jgi:hypothetical protein